MYETLWSNDGTGSAGGEPANPTSIPVDKGLYALLLGDTNLTHMTPVPATVFSNPIVHLRVWFDDGWQVQHFGIGNPAAGPGMARSRLTCAPKTTSLRGF